MMSVGGWKEMPNKHTLYYYAALYKNRLFVAAICTKRVQVDEDLIMVEEVRRTAIVFSLGCQLACKIFLLKSSVSSCMASLSPRCPFFMPCFPGSGPPIFLALNADLSACNTMSFIVSASYIRKKLWYEPVSTCLCEIKVSFFFRKREVKEVG